MIREVIETKRGKFVWYDMVQQSPDWFMKRCGRPSASKFHTLITPANGQPAKGDTMRSYMKTLIAELVMRKPIEKIGSTYWLERGNELEPRARQEYAFLRGIEVQPAGFWMNEAEQYGASPDGLVGDDGLVEFKTGTPETIVGYALEPESLVKAHYPQIQGQLLCTGRDWVDIMAYDPEIKPVVRRVERDEEYLAKLETALTAFLEQMNAACERLIADGYLVIDPEPQEQPTDYLMAG